jgi:hypothetical protein
MRDGDAGHKAGRNGVLLWGVLALIAGGAFIVVSCGYRGVDVWVWDWADVTFSPRYRTRWGTPWKSLARMRLQFGFMGAGLVILGLVAMTR